MHKALTPVALTMLLAIPSLAHAEKFQIENTTVIGNDKNGNQKLSYEIDGQSIQLTDKEKVLAKNWRLKEEEYARYKYIMEFTPRGLWSPDIDPPIALGNEAETEQERLHYAQIMNDIELERRDGEMKFQQAGIKDIDERLNAQGYVKLKDREFPKKGEFSKSLPSGKLTLRSLFVDMETCDRDCKVWVMKQMLIVSKTVQLDLYVANSSDYSDAELYKELSINPAKVQNGSINISRDSTTYKAYQKGWETPFLIQRSDHGTKRKGLHKPAGAVE